VVLESHVLTLIILNNLKQIIIFFYLINDSSSIGRLIESIDSKTMNDSMPISLDHFNKEEI